MAQILPLEYNEHIVVDRPKAFEENVSKIITMGEMIGMIRLVLTSIIEAIEKSGTVGINYLGTNLKMMRDTAAHAKKAQQNRAEGMFNAAIIGISIAGAGIGASLAAGGKHASNANEMKKIQNAPLAQPPKVGSAANSGNSIGSVQGQAVGKGKSSIEMTDLSKPGMKMEAVPSKQREVAGGDKVLHGKDKNATSYATEAEKDRAIKIQEELNKKPTLITALAPMVNPQMLPVANLEQARKDDDAAKAEYVSGIERANSDAVKTLQGENGSFHGALSGLVDRLAIANIVTQTLIASSQWR